MTTLAATYGTWLAMAALIHATARIASHEHQPGEHYNGRCCICGGSITEETA